MPPKKKKPVLQDEFVQKTVDFVMKRWPEMNITVNMIKNPTREFVLKFYSDCVDELEDTIAEAILMNMDFKLGDLYQFDPFRLNILIHILTHFLYFTSNIKNEAVNICDKVFDGKQQLKDMEENQEQLKELKIQKQMELRDIQDWNKELQRISATITPAYEKTMDLIEKSEENCKHKIFEIEKLKEELRISEEEIQKLEKVEQDLRAQVITESEYKMLKDKLDSLKIEESNLEDIDLNNFLFEQNKQIEHLQICDAKLEQLQLSEDIYKLSEFRKQLQNEQHNLQHILNLHNNEKDELKNKQLSLDNENSTKEAMKMQLNELQMMVDEIKAQETELIRRKEQMDTESSEVMERILKLKKLKENQNVLRADIREKYNAICEIQDRTLNKFRHFVTKKTR
ncbi:hypothetical protein GWI33_017328 [Rhynchophorus ferrugineus]|uniref:Uncharacterized protein n=1 Tax=Rhynchophorus ferrugineus TaxID=354439 RepID=A0A834I007_RHYFE|nr:hypothetical protein GWI33_017328 [Rhynchophorus ferrugineus]